MTADPEPFLRHNTLWRRLQRRYLLDGFSLLGSLFVCPPALCSVSWLLHGPLWFTRCWGALWFLMSAFMMVMMTFSTIALKRRGLSQTRPLPNRLSLYWMIGLHLSTCIALLMGRVDGAFYLAFGLSEGSGLWNDRAKPLQTAARFLIASALCIAFAQHATGLVISLMIFQLLRSACVRPALKEVIQRLPTRAEHVTRNREACAAGGG